MVTHIVMWNFDASLTEETKKQAAAEMKEKLEALLKEKNEEVQE